MRRVLFASALAACGAPVAAPAAAPPAPPRPALTLVPAEVLLAARTRDDTAAIRAHAWQQWLDLTRGPAPAWETWVRSDLVFSAAPLAATSEIAFRPPRPITQEGVPIATDPMLYDVLLDPEAARFVRDRGLARRAGLAALPGHIPELPTDAAALKLVWVAIRRTGLTAVPVWDDAPARPDAAGNPPSTWSRVVAVDPARTAIPAGETADVESQGHAVRARVVPLAAFAHHRLTTEGEVRTARAVVGPTVERGDEVALVAVHLTTKEIPDWTWATWWWHDRADAGPFAAGRPAALAGWAASYRMDATLSPDAPCMNPWLEARFPGGVGSSCASCHQRAAFGAHEFLPVPASATPLDDPYFTGKVTTDFLWSIALEAK